MRKGRTEVACHLPARQEYSEGYAAHARHEYSEERAIQEKEQEGPDNATAPCQKELAEFSAEEKDLLQSISAMKPAATVRSKHHPNSLIEVPQVHLQGQREVRACGILVPCTFAAAIG